MPSKELEAGTASHHLKEQIDSTKDMPTHYEVADEQTSHYIIGQAVEIDVATDKRLFWKINRRVLAIQLVTYFCQSLDKGTLNFASIMGIKTDAHLVGQQVCSPSLMAVPYG